MTSRPPVDAFVPVPDDNEVGHPTDVDDLAELRRLLLGAERAEIERIKARLDDAGLTVEQLSELLPEAIVARSKRDAHLGKALASTVEEALKTSVRRDPRTIVDAIFPVMGPAIRKAIAQAMSGLVQTLNTAIEHSLSLRGLTWRVEALRAGVPFAQVVMRHTLLYKVDQVFLFHRETGLLLSEVRGPGITEQDPDLVAAMMTALKDFAADSFNAREGDDLTTFTVGDQVVRVVQGPQAVLMALVRGHAPNELQIDFQDALETIHLDLSDELDTFEGNAAPFEATKPMLEPLLQMEVKERARKGMSPGLIAVVALMVVLVGAWAFVTARAASRWTRLVDRWSVEPGLVVVDAERDGRRFLVTGLRDAAAIDPASVVPGTGLDLERIHMSWEPYLSLHPDIVARRATARLEAPATVQMTMRSDTLVATGAAPNAWIRRATREAPHVFGVGAADLTGISNLDVRGLRQAADSVERQRVTFASGSAVLTADARETVTIIARQLNAIAQRARDLDVALAVDLVGRADTIGAEAANLALSRARAGNVSAALRQAGVTDVVITTVVLGSSDPLSAAGVSVADRSVSFRVRIEPVS